MSIQRFRWEPCHLSPNLTGYQKPENVLQNFMMHEFVGTKLFNNLIVPGAGQAKKVE